MIKESSKARFVRGKERISKIILPGEIVPSGGAILGKGERIVITWAPVREDVWVIRVKRKNRGRYGLGAPIVVDATEPYNRRRGLEEFVVKDGKGRITL